VGSAGFLGCSNKVELKLFSELRKARGKPGVEIKTIGFPEPFERHETAIQTLPLATFL
jgi:hypothetical protein